jgi:hypothetical protein
MEREPLVFVDTSDLSGHFYPTTGNGWLLQVTQYRGLIGRFGNARPCERPARKLASDYLPF